MFDAVVAGGGPAGAAVASRLAGCGFAVALLELGRYERPRPGETLAPEVRPLLAGLGLWERFQQSGPVPSWETRSCWGGPPATASHLVNPYGSGWHVDRAAFDRMLVDSAASAGADVRLGVSASHYRFADDVWEVTTSAGLVRGRVLVDATGRRAAVARALGAHRLPFDRLVGLAASVPEVNTSAQGYLLVETAADGWWYTAPVPGGELVGVLMTDADLSRAGRLARPSAWRARLAGAPATAERLAGRATSVPKVFPAASHRLRRGSDARPWVAVGDAALAVDPISGTGVVRALRRAEAAAGAVEGLLRSRDAADYEAVLDAECTEYLTRRAAYYRLEQRFASLFWARRS
jgi:flavin-dependent dehydrogenase